jgi:hypothetical protein
MEMTDYYVTAVRYDEKKSHITHVHVRHRNRAELTVGAAMVSSREFVANLITTETANFRTAVWNTDTKVWNGGERIHVVGESFLSTDRNGQVKDNLGELKEFKL